MNCTIICAADGYSYAGHAGQACKGYVSWCDEYLDGKLDCDDATKQPPAPW